MPKNKLNPFENLVLDKYELELEEALNKGEFVSTKNLEKTKKMFQEAAKNYLELQKSKSVTLRIKNEDLVRIKAKAKRKNVAYQTLIGLLIRQYVEDKSTITL